MPIAIIGVLRPIMKPAMISSKYCHRYKRGWWRNTNLRGKQQTASREFLIPPKQKLNVCPKGKNTSKPTGRQLSRTSGGETQIPGALKGQYSAALSGRQIH